MPRNERDLGVAIRQPMILDYHPVYRFYHGGGLTRKFRGMADTSDSWWSEDWVGSCTHAGNPDPAGGTQGLTVVNVPGVGPVTLRDILYAHPVELVGAEFASRWGLTTGVLVKVLSPGGPVPLHAHPDRVFANRYLDSRWGKTEAWIMLDCPGDGREPAYGGMGFRPGITKETVREMVERQNHGELRTSVHRFELAPNQVWVAHAGIPHLLGPHVVFIELQEPSDHIVIPEWNDSGADEEGATMALGWDLALDMLDYDGSRRDAALTRSKQVPREWRRSAGGSEIGLIGDDVRFSFFDASKVEVESEIDVADERFYIGIVYAGSGRITGDFDQVPIGRGQSFFCAAALPHTLVSSGAEPLTVIRCMGPAISYAA